MNGKNCIVIDLDDTMLDTKRMYDSLINKELSLLGVTSEIFWLTSEKEFQDRKGDGMYSLENHLDILARDIGKNPKALKSIITEFLAKNSGKYIFPDVADFLDSYCKQAKIIILTKGPKELQSLKIAGLEHYIDLGKIFADIVITDKDKGFIIEKICDEENRLNVFIDDSLIQIDSVGRARPDVNTFWIKRNIKRVNREKSIDVKKVNFDYKVATLSEVDGILSEMV